MASDPYDLIEQQDEYAANSWDIVLWPRYWQACSPGRTLSWTICKLDKSLRSTIPQRPGLYSLLVQPGIADHPACSVLMYIGQAVDLNNRFYDYCTRERRIRPKVSRMLLKLDDFVYFCYCELPKPDLDSVEDHLIESFWPYANDRLPDRLGKVKDAF
jgi:hypothetical protein